MPPVECLQAVLSINRDTCCLEAVEIVLKVVSIKCKQILNKIFHLGPPFFLFSVLSIRHGIVEC